MDSEAVKKIILKVKNFHKPMSARHDPSTITLCDRLLEKGNLSDADLVKLRDHHAKDSCRYDGSIVEYLNNKLSGEI